MEVMFVPHFYLIRFNIPVNFKLAWDINVFGEPAEANATHKVNIR
jgi:hypothetical protein